MSFSFAYGSLGPQLSIIYTASGFDRILM